jgi:hypothetical protein
MPADSLARAEGGGLFRILWPEGRPLLTLRPHSQISKPQRIRIIMNKMSIIAVSDDWDTVPSENSNSLIRGKIVKFREREFVVDKQCVINGASFVVEGVAVVWVKWTGGKPVEHRITQSGQRHPNRDELPDQDEELWELGRDGKRANPWHDTRYVYLIDRKTAEEVTFVTDSDGGRRAVGDLSGQIALARKAHPRAAPIVELVVGPGRPDTA